jgi:hypothetical protein
MLRLVSPSPHLTLRAAHHESAGRNPDQLHADIVGDFLGRVLFLGWGAARKQSKNRDACQAEKQSHIESSV